MSETKDENQLRMGKKTKIAINQAGRTQIKAGTKIIGNTISPKVIQQL